MLTLQNLPPIPVNKLYRLWAFFDSKKVKFAKFHLNYQGRGMQEITLKEWGSTTKVFVTIKPKQGLLLANGETLIRGIGSI